MDLSFHSPSFWTSAATHVAVRADGAHEAEGLAKFATASEATRGLLFFQTSGSESAPKWVGISRQAFLDSARSVSAHLEVTARDRWLIALPLHHVGGFSIFARCHVSGSSLFQGEEKWNPYRFAETCAVEGITLTSLVPTQVFDLVQAEIRAPGPLRAVIVGGGGLNKELGHRSMRLGWPVMQSYGMTETSSQVATEPLDHLYQGFDPERLEVLGGWDVETDADDLLTVRGPALASGYASLRKGVWHWEALDPARGLVTRDRVRLWMHGSRKFLRVLGRESQFLKVKGELLHLATIQSRVDFLRLTLGLSDRLVVAPMPDARRETRLVLVGEKGGMDKRTMMEILERHNALCAPHERLHEVALLKTIPVSDMGKVNLAAVCGLLANAQC